MFITALYCQMGNQMFQYAFALAKASREHAFWLPFQCDPYYPMKLGYFKTDWFTRLVYGNPKLTRQYHRVCRKLVEYVFVNQTDDHDGFFIADTQMKREYCKGFYQGDSYFKGCEHQIRRAFEIRPEYGRKFEEKYAQFFKENKVVVVHIRRTDYVEVEFPGMGGKDVSLPMKYYEKALSLIPNIDEYKVVFVSDDISGVKKDFGNMSDYYFESNSSIVDFQIIQHADVAIISNSTFAWWAAWLNEKPNKRVLAPKYWLGHKVKQTFPVGIETNKFEWIEY